MKRLFFFILNVIIAFNGYSQVVVDSIIYRFVYDAQLKEVKDLLQLRPDEHCLEIGCHGVSKYYSRWKAKRKEIVDSINAIGGSYTDIIRENQSQGAESSSFIYEIIKNYPKNGEQTINLFSIQNLQYTEKACMEWIVEEGDTIIMNHPCSKASTDYHGRIWTAWYALDIPIADGPWKLCGLPGLILHASDTNGEYIFNCIGIEQVDKTPMTMYNKRITKIEAKKAHKTIEAMENDPIGYINMTGKKVKMTIMDKNGRVISDMPKIDNRVFIETYH